MPDGFASPEDTGPDVALGEHGMGGEVGVGERFHLGGRDLRLEPLEVDFAIAG